MKTVIIVGAGPVGAMAACYMARRSAHVEVFEMRKDLRFTETERKSSPTLTISYRGLEALRGVNVENEIIEMAAILYGDIFHETSGGLREKNFGKRENIIYCVDRHKVNQVLLSAAEKRKNVNIHFEHKLLECDLDRCSATFRRSDGSVLNVNGDIIIGCDGVFSTVRRQMMRKPHFNYSQFYIPHECFEFTIPPSEEKESIVKHNYGHIWLRKDCVMFSHPNFNKSATVSVLLPKEMIQSLKTGECGVRRLFREYFKDVLPLIDRAWISTGESNTIVQALCIPLIHIGNILAVIYRRLRAVLLESVAETITKAKSYPIVTVKCTPYHYHDKAVLLGDAAHAMLPLYGQGVNCGLEDCIILDELMTKHSGDMETILAEFTSMRSVDTSAMSDLAIQRYLQFTQPEGCWWRHWRDTIDLCLSKLFPGKWVSLYTSLVFTRKRYQDCIKQNSWQNEVVMWCEIVGVALIFVGGCCFYRIFM